MSASVGVHTLVLALLTSVAPRLLTVPRRAVEERPAVDLQLSARSSEPTTAAPAAANAPSVANSPPAHVAPRGVARPPVPAASAPAATAPSTRPATAAPVTASDGDGRWRVDGDSGDAGAAARALARGTVGCDHDGWLRLTAGERERCDSRFVEGARFGPRVDALPAAKRAYYDQVRDAYAKMREGAPLPFTGAPGERYGNLGVDERWAGPKGAHLPGFGCSPSLLGRKAPPHSLKLGPCVITPPSGLGTEEADVGEAASAGVQRRDAAASARFDPPSPRP